MQKIRGNTNYFYNCFKSAEKIPEESKLIEPELKQPVPIIISEKNSE